MTKPGINIEIPGFHPLEIRTMVSDHDVAKQQYVQKLKPDHVVAFGNGNNDR